jgi:hypothetical protein
MSFILASEFIICGILAIALRSIHKTMLEFQNIGISMTKLVAHLGSFVIYILSTILLLT